MDYKTEDEAYKSRLLSKEYQKSKYCPLIKDKCRLDCECFFPGRVWNPCGTKVEQTVWRVTDACCSNAMFTGERE